MIMYYLFIIHLYFMWINIFNIFLTQPRPPALMFPMIRIKKLAAAIVILDTKENSARLVSNVFFYLFVFLFLKSESLKARKDLSC